MGRAAIVAFVLGLALAAPAQAAPHFAIGQGMNPGVAIDPAGTAYIGWQSGVYGGADTVQLCVLPAAARACPTPATVPFPGSGLGNGRVSVLLPAPNVVQVAVARNVGNVYGFYLSTSTDGGATFAPAIRIAGAFARRAALFPGGLVAVEGDDVRSLTGAVVRPDGSDATNDGTVVDERAQFADVAVQGSDVYVAGSLAGPTAVARLPAGGAWQPLPDIADGNSPRLAPGPAGPVALLQPNAAGRVAVFVRRWTGAAWTPAVTVGGDNSSDSFALTGAGNRLVAAWSRHLPNAKSVVQFATALDGGALWSTPSTTAVMGDSQHALQAAVTPAGNGVLVAGGDAEDEPIDVFRVDPHRAKVARARFGTTTVQLRADDLDCVNETHVSVRIQAARNGLLVSPGTVLRRARVAVTRSRTLRRSRWATLVDLRRPRARRTAIARLTPRHGRARTIRLPVNACGRVS